MPLAFPYVLIIYLLLLVTQCILNSAELKCTENIKLHHFVHTILSVPFCPMPFCPYTILSIPFCPVTFKSSGEIIMFAKHWGKLLKHEKYGINSKFVVDD